MRKHLSVFPVVLACAALGATVAAGAPPPGATAQCQDGTYSFSQHRSGTCSYHGGVAVWLAGGSTSTGSSSSGSSKSASAACGVERWTVKTLQDRPALLPAQMTTIRNLVTRPSTVVPPNNSAPV